MLFGTSLKGTDMQFGRVFISSRNLGLQRRRSKGGAGDVALVHKTKPWAGIQAQIRTATTHSASLRGVPVQTLGIQDDG